MFLIEITYPEGVLDAGARAEVAAALTAALNGNDDAAAPEATMKRARAMTHVAFHPAQSWTTGHGALPADQPPPYIVTITVPEAWRKEISSHSIAQIPTILERHDPAGAARRPGGHLWVNVVGVRDGSIGLNGKPSSADDVLMYMTEEYRASGDADADLPDGVVVDPICGMRVRLGPKAITLNHHGDTLGFCSKGCRASYAHQHRIEPARS